MESDTGNVRGNDQMILPPGFRFHPTDEELITHYLSKKVINSGFSAVAVSDVDMNRVEPWELPWKAKIGENEWYFFCAKDKKYPTGHRTNRATASGYWKSTGKDKEIFRGKSLVGMKKTLVFYKGRAPKGEKTNWVAHEYRLEGKCAHDNLTKSDWVIMRVFHKSCAGKKFHLAELTRPSHELVSSSSSLTRSVREHNEPGSSHVSCFSSLIPNDDIIHGNFATCFDNPIISSTSDHVDSFELDDYAFSVGQLSCSIEIDISNENLSQILKQGRDQ